MATCLLFVESINTNLKPTPQQVNAIAIDLIQDCPDWSIYDFVLFFRGCTKGKYGDVKYGVDQARIYEFKTKYEEERCEARERIGHNEKFNTEKRNLDGAGKTIFENIDKLPDVKEALKNPVKRGGIGSRLREAFDKRFGK